MAKRKPKTINFDFSSLSFDFGNVGDTPDPEADEDAAVRDLLKTAKLHPKPVLFENAEVMAKAIDLSEDYFALVPGSFVFGDLLEALCLKRALQPKTLYVTTLGLSPDNIDSLVNLHDYLGCSQVNLIVSSYFATVKRNETIPYIVGEFAGRDMNLAVCANHAKIALFERSGPGGDFVIFGSANLASSANLEVSQSSMTPRLLISAARCYLASWSGGRLCEVKRAKPFLVMTKAIAMRRFLRP